jgi:hypothetical protein
LSTIRSIDAVLSGSKAIQASRRFRNSGENVRSIASFEMAAVDRGLPSWAKPSCLAVSSRAPVLVTRRARDAGTD